MKLIDLTGHRFGRLTVLTRNKNKNGRVSWLCQCDCGNERIVRRGNLRSGHTKSCGCLHDENRYKFIGRNITHGMTYTKTYSSWKGMLKRCNKPNDKEYKNYGARGIKVCERWLRFENFYQDMGEQPKGLTIERLDNSKGYSSNNCIYATRKEQANNKRDNIVIEYKGEKHTMMQWSEKLGINYYSLRYRLRKACWPVERALTQAIEKPNVLRNTV